MLRLKSVEFSEEVNKQLFWQNQRVLFDDYNLIIGPNASGKSLFIQRLMFLKNVHTKNIPTPSILSDTSFKLTFLNTETKDEISYELSIHPDQELEERIQNLTSNITLFSSEKKQFYDEKAKKNVTQLIPKKIAVTKLVEDEKEKYPTINELGKFLSNMLFLKADHYDPTTEIFGPNQAILDEKMRNLGSVIINWKKNADPKYTILLNTIKLIFPYIEDFAEFNDPRRPYPSFSMLEANVNEPIPICCMSTGILRVLGILALSLSQSLDIAESPSMIVIDEIDNGVDFENLDKIIEFIKDRSDITQFVFSSHSPVICNFVEPKYWRVFSRNKNNVQVRIPTETQETLELIKRAEISNWDLYKNHISKSKLYRSK